MKQTMTCGHCGHSVCTVMVQLAAIIAKAIREAKQQA